MPEFQLICRSLDTGETLDIVGHSGEWSLPWLRPGTYELSARSILGSSSTRVVVQSGSTQVVAIVLERSELDQGESAFFGIEQGPRGPL